METEEALVQAWLATYEPAVKVTITPRRVLMCCSRPGRDGYTASVPRGDDLQHDLDAALRDVVASLG